MVRLYLQKLTAARTMSLFGLSVMFVVEGRLLWYWQNGTIHRILPSPPTSLTWAPTWTELRQYFAMHLAGRAWIAKLT